MPLRLPPLRRAWILALGLLAAPGCAVMNTFQTPDVLPPGTALLSPGIALGSPEQPVLGDLLGDDTPLPAGRGIGFQGRLGVLPHVDVGVHVAGLNAFGADVKGGGRRGPLHAAVNAGFGTGGVESSGLTGYTATRTRTRFGGVFLGISGAYLGVKLIDYHHEVDPPEAEPRDLDRLVPAIALGFAGAGRGSVRPVTELNVYDFPGGSVVTFGVGVQVRIGE